MDRCTIRPVMPAEATALADIGRSTFLATFADANNADDIERYVSTAFSVGRMRKELETSGSSFFFAIIDDEIAGYLKLNCGQAQTEPMGPDSMEIERIYVRPGHQGLGIGKSLLDYVLAEADRRQASSVWLGVWEDNRKAIAFYEARGFVAFGRHDFTIGSDVQTDILMRRPL